MKRVLTIALILAGSYCRAQHIYKLPITDTQKTAFRYFSRVKYAGRTFIIIDTVPRKQYVYFCVDSVTWRWTYILKSEIK